MTGSKKGCRNGSVYVGLKKSGNKRLVLHVLIRCGSLSITTPVSLLANEFDLRSVLHVQVSLATVNHIYVIHSKSEDSLKVNVNICEIVKIMLNFWECN